MYEIHFMTVVKVVSGNVVDREGSDQLELDHECYTGRIQVVLFIEKRFLV